MNNVTIITGASRGIGRATALLLGSQGHKVCVGYCHQRAAAMAVVAEIKAAGGCAIAIPVDIGQEQQVVDLFQQVDDQLGSLTGLVNNAGILFKQATIEQLDAERINRVLAINVTGTFLCAREAVKRMALRHGGKGGSIVNVSSVASRLGAPHEYVDYAASKGAVDTLSIGLSLEVADQGIRVNTVRPGLIYTDIHGDGGEPGRVDRLSSMLPMKRGGQPEEVAEAISWLLSDKSSYMTGGFLDLAGGR